METIKQSKIEKDINLRELFRVVKERIWVVIVLTILFTIAGAVYTSLNKTPLYQSSARIIIGAEPEYRNTLQVIIKDSVILEKVIHNLKIRFSSEDLAKQINVESVDNTQIVSINAIDTNPERAANIANTTAMVFKEEIPSIVGFSDVRYLSEAKPNLEPINENGYRKIVIAFVIGLLSGVGLVFLLDSLDDTVKSHKQIEQILDLKVIGKISKIRNKNANKKEREKEKLELDIRGETIGYK